MPILKLVIMLSVGILIAEPIGSSSLGIQVVACMSIFFLIIGILSHKSNRITSSIFILLVAIGLGILCYSQHSKPIGLSHFSMVKNNKFLIGQVKSIKQSNNSIQCIVKIAYVGDHMDSLVESKGNILSYLPLSEAKTIAEGHHIIFPNNSFPIYHNPNPFSFDYKKFLSRKKIFHQTHIKDYTTISKGYKNPIQKIAVSSKNYIQKQIHKYIKSISNKAIAQAMLLGDRTLIDEDLNAAYSNTGAIHILAVSGLHIGIVGMIILVLLRPLRVSILSDRIICVMAISVVWLYVIITGSGPPSVRAATVYSLFLTAPIAAKYFSTLNTISTAAMAILLFNPHQLFTISFQFSFLAVISIITFYPILERFYISSSKIKTKLYGLIIISVSAQILLTPLSIYYFHKFPLLFIISGMLAVPLAFLILLVSIVLLIFSLVPFMDGVVTSFFGQLLDWLLSFLNFFINSINQFPYATIDNIWLSDYGLLACYIGLALLIIGVKTRKAIFVYTCLGIFIAQGLMHRINKKKTWEESSVVVYHMYKNSVIEYINNGYRTYLSDNVGIEKNEKYNCHNFRTKMMVKGIRSIKDSHIEELYGLHRIRGKLILINPKEELLDYKMKSKVDLFILNSNDYNLHRQVIEKFEFDNIVIDGRVTRNKHKLRKLATEKNISFHDTADGAYIYKLEL